MNSSDALTCASKERMTYQRAAKVAHQMRRAKDVPIKAYRCPACHWWHVCGVDELERQPRRIKEIEKGALN